MQARTCCGQALTPQPARRASRAQARARTGERERAGGVVSGRGVQLSLSLTWSSDRDHCTPPSPPLPLSPIPYYFSPLLPIPSPSPLSPPPSSPSPPLTHRCLEPPKRILRDYYTCVAYTRLPGVIEGAVFFSLHPPL